MNAQMPLTSTAILQKDITPQGGDYETVRRVIEKISLDYRDQPSLETLARRSWPDAHRLAETVHPLGRPFAQGFSAGASRSTTRESCSTRACRCSKPRSRSACPAPAGCTTCS